VPRLFRRFRGVRLQKLMQQRVQRRHPREVACVAPAQKMRRWETPSLVRLGDSGGQRAGGLRGRCTGHLGNHSKLSCAREEQVAAEEGGGD
jgi:hypothetical protein